MYTSAEKIAALLNIDEDDVAESTVTHACSLVDNTLGTSFGEVTITDELYDGSGCDSLILNNFPVSAVTKVEWEDADRVWHELDEEEFVLYADTGIIKLKLLPNSDWFSLVDYHNEAVFEEGTLNWRISYSYGDDSIPSLIELLATLFGAQLYCVQRGLTDEVSSERIGDYSIAYNSSSESTVKISKLIEQIVSNYEGGNSFDVRAI